MRIVLISSEYPPADHLGGIGTNTATVAPALARLGHDVCVVTAGPPGVSKDRDVTVVRPRHRWVPNRTGEVLLRRAKIASAAAGFRPDVVQAAEWEAEAWWIARFGRVPVLTRLATPSYLLEEMNYNELDARARLIRALERDQTRRSAAVFAPTKAIADRVGGDWSIPEETVRLIPNPFEFDQVLQAGSSKPPFELPERFLVFIGRMERRKGIEVLAQALPRVLGDHTDLEAIFIGRDPGDEDGALMERFNAAIAPLSDRVHVVGALPRNEALAIVARAELVVLPSLWESFGYVASEAMALGRPVVATDTGGFPEFIEDGRTGSLVPAGDVAALGDAMLTRLADPSGSRLLGENAARAVQSFDIDNVVAKIVDLYEEAIERRNGGGEFDSTVYRRGYRRYFRADDPKDPFHELYERKRKTVLAQLGSLPRLKILDVGGGYGRLAGPLSETHEVTLSDISPEMIEEARRRGLGTLDLVVADARDLPFEDGRFDVVLALDLMPHLPDLGPGITELARVTRSGGTLVFDTTNALPLWVFAYPSYVNWRPARLARTLKARGVLPEWRRIVAHHREKQVQAEISEAGLTLERVEGFGPPGLTKWHLWWTRKA